jgi:hypothetical protein
MSNLSRRSLVASAAALPALAVPAVAIAATAEPDPIFAAIEKFRTPEVAWLARCQYEEERGIDTPELAALIDACNAARSELADTIPTTPAGLIAYLDYIVSENDRLTTLEDGSRADIEIFLFVDDHETGRFVRSLARSAHRIFGEAVQS